MYGSYRKRSSSCSQTCSLMSETACVFELEAFSVSTTPQSCEDVRWHYLCSNRRYVAEPCGVEMKALCLGFGGGGLTSSCWVRKRVCPGTHVFAFSWNSFSSNSFSEETLIMNSALYLLWHINTFTNDTVPSILNKYY